ncbi:MAG TPA: hypothetical protein VGA66_04940 [Mycobacterium sp.]
MSEYHCGGVVRDCDVPQATPADAGMLEASMVDNTAKWCRRTTASNV